MTLDLQRLASENETDRLGELFQAMLETFAAGPERAAVVAELSALGLPSTTAEIRSLERVMHKRLIDGSMSYLELKRSEKILDAAVVTKSVANVAALTALDSATRDDLEGGRVYVEDIALTVFFDTTDTTDVSTDPLNFYIPDDVTHPDPGRWLVVEKDEADEIILDPTSVAAVSTGETTVQGVLDKLAASNAPGVQDLTALTALASADLSDKMIRLVEDTGRTYRYDAESVIDPTTDADMEIPDDVTHPAAGRWIAVEPDSADDISYDPTASGLVATEVQAALDEIATSIPNAEVVVGTDNAAQDLANIAQAVTNLGALSATVRGKIELSGTFEMGNTEWADLSFTLVDAKGVTFRQNGSNVTAYIRGTDFDFEGSLGTTLIRTTGASTGGFFAGRNISGLTNAGFSGPVISTLVSGHVREINGGASATPLTLVALGVLHDITGFPTITISGFWSSALIRGATAFAVSGKESHADIVFTTTVTSFCTLSGADTRVIASFRQAPLVVLSGLRARLDSGSCPIGWTVLSALSSGNYANISAGTLFADSIQVDTATDGLFIIRTTGAGGNPLEFGLGTRNTLILDLATTTKTTIGTDLETSEDSIINYKAPGDGTVTSVTVVGHATKGVRASKLSLRFSTAGSSATIEDSAKGNTIKVWSDTLPVVGATAATENVITHYNTATGVVTELGLVAALLANVVDSISYVDGSIDGEHLAQDAVDTVLGNKFIAEWIQINSFSATGADDVVTVEVEAAATDNTERNTVNGLGILSSGTTPNDATGTAYQNYKVQLRDATTEQPVDDGTGGEVYGVLSENAGVWTLTYFKADGTSYAAFAATSIDFTFAQVTDMRSISGTALLVGPTFGDISEGGAGSHNHDGRYFTETELGTVGGTEGADRIGVDASALGTDSGAIDNVKGVLDAHDTGIGTNASAISLIADAVPTILDKDLVALVTTLDDDKATNAVITATPANNGNVTVHVNTLRITVGDAVKTKPCFFSGDGGTTPRAIADIIATDTLHWVGSVAGYQLAVTDRIDYDYNV